MKTKSLIDDIYDDSDNGPAICFSNAEIRKLLRLARASENDVLFDFGSGWGQLLIVALTEFGVRRAVGFERLPSRFRTCMERLERWSATRDDISKDQQWSLVKTNFYRFLEDKKTRARLAEATIIFYGLETDKWTLDQIEKAWAEAPKRTSRRLVSYYNCLFPEIMPDAEGVNYPFVVSTFPFKAPRDELSWLTSITGKTASSLRKGKRPAEEELWDELKHDYRVCSSAPVSETIGNYKRRLNQVIKR